MERRRYHLQFPRSAGWRRRQQWRNLYTLVANSWHVAGIGDFDRDGRDDILWRNDNGGVFNFLSTENDGVVNNGDNSYAAMSNAWHIEAIGDYNGDGRDDILWRHDDGTITNWLATEAGGFTANEANLMTNVGLQWQVQPNFSGIGDWDYRSPISPPIAKM